MGDARGSAGRPPRRFAVDSSGAGARGSVAAHVWIAAPQPSQAAPPASPLAVASGPRAGQNDLDSRSPQGGRSARELPLADPPSPSRDVASRADTGPRWLTCTPEGGGGRAAPLVRSASLATRPRPRRATSAATPPGGGATGDLRPISARAPATADRDDTPGNHERMGMSRRWRPGDEDRDGRGQGWERGLTATGRGGHSTAWYGTVLSGPMERGRAPGDDRRSHHGTRILNRLYTYHAPGPRYGLVGLVESSILPMMMMMMVTDLMRFSDGDAFLSSTLLESSPRAGHLPRCCSWPTGEGFGCGGWTRRHHTNMELRRLSHRAAANSIPPCSREAKRCRRPRLSLFSLFSSAYSPFSPFGFFSEFGGSSSGQNSAATGELSRPLRRGSEAGRTC
ncbi:unnamed protein product [Diplocarpon coronariae]